MSNFFVLNCFAKLFCFTKKAMLNGKLLWKTIFVTKKRSEVKETFFKILRNICTGKKQRRRPFLCFREKVFSKQQGLCVFVFVFVCVCVEKVREKVCVCVFLVSRNANLDSASRERSEKE